jgi:hypothetical protein
VHKVPGTYNRPATSPRLGKPDTLLMTDFGEEEEEEEEEEEKS